MLTIEGLCLSLSLIPAVHAGAGELLSGEGGRGSEGGDRGLTSPRGEHCSAHPGLCHTDHWGGGRGRSHRASTAAEVAL